MYAEIQTRLVNSQRLALTTLLYFVPFFSHPNCDYFRETTKDIVTAVTHHDINGLNAVSTVALKDIDVQMSALSGYETYV